MIPRWKIKLCWGLALSTLIMSAIKFAIQPNFSEATSRNLSRTEFEARAEAIKSALYDELFDYGIRVDWISGDSVQKVVRIPEDLPMIEPYSALVAEFKALDTQLIRAETNPDGNVATLEVGLNEETVVNITLRKDTGLRRVAGEMVLFLVDLGRARPSFLSDFFQLDEVNFSVVAGQRHSEKIAREVIENERLLAVQLFDEFSQKKNDSEHSEETLRKKARQIITSMPDASVFLLTSNPVDIAFRGALHEEIKRAGLTVYAIPDGVRLDAIQEAPYIRQQLFHLAETASIQGRAIGILTLHKETLKALKTTLPGLQKKGFRLVKFTDLLN